MTSCCKLFFVPTFTVNPQDLNFPTLPARLLLLVGCYAPLYFAIEYFWRGHGGRTSFIQMVSMALIQSIFFAISMSFFYKRAHTGYEISVDDDESRITRNFRTSNHLSARTVRRGQNRTVIERRQGLLISGRNKIGTFLWGGIWVPKTLAEYEFLKSLALSWKKSSQTA
jgi:hypothetical protein